MPNGKFGHKKSKTFFFQKVRIYSPRAMGKGQGPAAEGLAHKIRRNPAEEAGRDQTGAPSLQNLHS